MNGHDVTRRCGITWRQLDYWATSGYLSDDGGRRYLTGSGNDREYTFTEVRRLDLMVRMVRCGIKTSLAATYAREMVRTNCTSLSTAHGVRIEVFG